MYSADRCRQAGNSGEITMEAFNIQPALHGEAVSVRPLEAEDYSALYTVASDPLLWEGHPARTRYLESEFREWFSSSLESGAALVVFESPTGKIIGSSRFYFPPGNSKDLSIGFTFLDRAHWGGATNFSLKSLMLNYAFKWNDAIWFHVAPSNIRSRKSVEKIGAKLVSEETIRLGTEPESWCCYRILRTDWLDKASTPKVRLKVTE